MLLENVVPTYLGIYNAVNYIIKMYFILMLRLDQLALSMAH